MGELPRLPGLLLVEMEHQPATVPVPPGSVTWQTSAPGGGDMPVPHVPVAVIAPAEGLRMRMLQLHDVPPPLELGIIPVLLLMPGDPVPEPAELLIPGLLP